MLKCREEGSKAFAGTKLAKRQIVVQRRIPWVAKGRQNVCRCSAPMWFVTPVKPIRSSTVVKKAYSSQVSLSKGVSIAIVYRDKMHELLCFCLLYTKATAHTRNTEPTGQIASATLQHTLNKAA